MNKMLWCLTLNKSLELVEPNANLSKAYQEKGAKALETMREITDKEWKISAAYYSMYFSLYAILQKTGIKCENHTCSIEFAKVFLTEYFTSPELTLISDSMQARVDSQYYTNREVSEITIAEMIKQAPLFWVKCRGVVDKLDEKKVQKIRDNFRKFMKKE